MVLSFEYLWRVISVFEDDWPVVVAYLWKEHNNWTWVSWFLGWEGVDAKTLGLFTSWWPKQ